MVASLKATGLLGASLRGGEKHGSLDAASSALWCKRQLQSFHSNWISGEP